MTTDERPLVILQPAQQRGERIFTAAARSELETAYGWSISSTTTTRPRSTPCCPMRPRSPVSRTCPWSGC